MTRVLLWDETTAGERCAAGELSVDEGRLSLREIIRRRVIQDFARFEAESTGKPAVFRGPVGPAGRGLGADKQYALALGAFARNGFIVLVDDRQVEDLDELLDLRTGVEVVFLKLVALVGG